MRRPLTYFLVLCAAVGGASRLAAAEDNTRLRYEYTAYGYSSSQRLARPSGVFYEAKRGELYVADTGNSQIVILDGKGMPVDRIRRQIRDPVSGDRAPGEPKSVVVRGNGDILVTDNLCGYVEALDSRGRSLWKLWPADLLGLDRTKVRPGQLALDALGNVLVGVSGDVNAILVLTQDLNLKAVIGKTEGPGSALKAVTGLWVDQDGKIYATYAQGECVRVFSPDGQLLTSFGAHDSGPENFSLPSGLVTDARGYLWIVDGLRHVITVFKPEKAGRELKFAFVSMPIGGVGRGVGELSYPTDIAGDGSSKIFVLEGAGARVQAFTILLDGEARLRTEVR